MRRIEMDRDIQEKKVVKLQKDLLDMDRKKYQAELKAKEMTDSIKKSQRSSMMDAKTLLTQQSSMEQKLLKSELEQRKKDAQIQKLQEQIRYNLSRHPQGAASNIVDSARKQPLNLNRAKTDDDQQSQ